MSIKNHEIVDEVKTAAYQGDEKGCASHLIA